ncbi:DNA recombination protein RmuC [Conexibacter sp. S30A1]|uniref:DNA recombination protein RmuC n=1 Tax=Conexibacter sp. S30A1 TaxID=2937800 RepID=UPI00200E2A45|nr:DNA recombination protein RmuC [Conexibacter sp. S30A1]
MIAVYLSVGFLGGVLATLLVMRERVRSARMALDSVQTTLRAHTGETLQSTVQAALAQLGEQNRLQFEASQAQASSELDKRRAQVESLVAPLTDALGRVDRQIQQLARDQNTARGQMIEQMRALAALRQETGALATAMARPNSRGQWGQLQLRRVVELAGMVEHVDFEEQVSLQRQGATALRPDMIINLPGHKQIPVDAKAPPLPELGTVAPGDSAARLSLLQAHARGLRSHVNQLAAKEYWARLEGSPDFVVMFLPGEHVYSAALEGDPALMEHAMSSRVLIATPTTLLALLHSAAYGWQQQRVSDSARAIAEVGRELHARLAAFTGRLAKVGRGLASAVNAYNEAVGSYEARLLVTARRFGELGAVSEGQELPALERLDVGPRSLQDIAGDELVAADEQPGLRSAAGP